MKIICCFINLLFCIFSTGFAQVPAIKLWDYRYGGDDHDEFTSIIITRDTGFMLGGFSQSPLSGNKTQPVQGLRDYWIVKLNSLGLKKWDKDFGGSDYDYFSNVIQCDDMGYLLSGYSMSGISGDKSEASWGLADMWIIKTDSNGTKLWDRDFGGTADESLTSAAPTRDGGFILGGSSMSGISGDKTQPVNGLHDYWIVKTDSLGNKLWDKDFGGLTDNILGSVQQTFDGGYILAGHSSSGIGGDKTNPTFGNWDFWIVRTDSLGNKLWDKDFGGTDIDFFNCMIQTSDSGFIFCGRTLSGISGNKTTLNKGVWDYWLIKTDSLGNKEWEKDIGGIFWDPPWNISETKDHGYIIGGSSDSPQGGDKSQNNLGTTQTWMVKIDSIGNLLWDKTVLAPVNSVNGRSIQTAEGCYISASHDNSGIGGDKSQPAWNGSYDYWIVKFCDSTFLPVAGLNAAGNLCPGGCTTFQNISTNATSFQWSFPGGRPDTSTAINPPDICFGSPGSYDVTLIATNSYGSDTLVLPGYVLVYPNPPPQSIIQYDDTLFAIQGSASYQWYLNGASINGATNFYYVATQNGNYNVIATDTNGCEAEAAILNVIAGLPSTVDRGLWTIFPNPVSDELYVIRRGGVIPLSGTAEAVVYIYNLMGDKVYEGKYLEPMAIDCENFPEGVYYLEVISEEHILQTRFVKQ